VKNRLTKSCRKTATGNPVAEINSFFNSFIRDHEDDLNGIFGFTAYDAVKYFEKDLYNKKESTSIPDIKYGFYKYIISIDHFKDEMRIIENCPDGEKSKLLEIQNLIQRQDVSNFSFKLTEKETVNISAEQFKKNVTKCKEHCKRGDVFQIVPSRQYSINFKGDEFNVYRQLRSINPSPYLFYFDYTDYKIFGSSPEAQIKITGSYAEIHPIAGTVKRSGDASGDSENATKLFNDPKENAEHIMLVDLARNDLSKHCSEVVVDKYKQVQYFSHVIHLTSIVKGKIDKGISPYQILADTFPAGTLSGAPKHKAIDIIEELEPTHRGFYGGAIGMIGFDGSLNHAIIIRSFLSQHNSLKFQAGAGIVINSDEESELQEVNNKLEALKKALYKTY
jgi:anthranilate synthase component 1